MEQQCGRGGGISVSSRKELVMNVSTLQKIDKWLGVPLCFLLTGCARLRFGSRRAADAANLRNLLIVKLAEQGSTVLAYPAFLRAVELVGRENVYCLVFEENRFILEIIGMVPAENVLTISTRNFLSLVGSSLRAFWRLWKLKLDAAIDMEFFTRASAVVTFLSMARRRVGFHSCFGAGPYRGNLMTHRLLYNPHLHATETFLMMIEALRVNADSLPTFPFRPDPSEKPLPQFVPRQDELAAVKELLGNIPGWQEGLFVLNPNASDLLPLRRWPNERYVELARLLLARHPECGVVMTGTATEAMAIGRLAAEVGSPRCLSVAGKTTLRQLLALYSLADVLVTNDSGPAHFASLTPIHVVTLFGPETPKLFGARSGRNTSLWAGLACSPCVNAFNNRQSRCRNNLCMQQITVEQVFAEACRAYEASKQAKRRC